MFRLGKKSLNELIGVDPRLIALVTRANLLTEQEFTVFDGLRTKQEQAALVSKGKSHLMRSKHLTGKAVDLVPWVRGRPVWDHARCCKIAAAMLEAYQEQAEPYARWCIRWGGVWDLVLHELDPLNLKQEIEWHKGRRAGRRIFIDSPHFEIKDLKR